jgi:hypothetical protein
VSAIVADAGLVVAFSVPSGLGPDVAGIERLVLGDLDQEAGGLR